VSAIEHSEILRKKVVLHREAPASRVLGIAISAGGLEPLIDVLSELPAAFLAAIVVVQHIGPVSRLPELLRSRVALRVKFAEPEEPLRRGVIYVTPPERHVIVNPHRTFTLSDAPRLRFQRPSADWFFRSAAASYGRRSIAVVLSGRLDDERAVSGASTAPVGTASRKRPSRACNPACRPRRSEPGACTRS